MLRRIIFLGLVPIVSGIAVCVLAVVIGAVAPYRSFASTRSKRFRQRCVGIAYHFPVVAVFASDGIGAGTIIFSKMRRYLDAGSRVRADPAN